jgi:hypothetical protein
LNLTELELRLSLLCVFTVFLWHVTVWSSSIRAASQLIQLCGLQPFLEALGNSHNHKISPAYNKLLRVRTLFFRKKGNAVVGSVYRVPHLPGEGC